MTALRKWFWGKLLPLIGAWMLRMLRATLRLRIVGEHHLAEFWENQRPIIAAFWHGQLLMMPYAWQNRGISVLVSQHRDGRLIGDIVSHWGFDLIHGSTTKGGVTSFRSLAKSLKAGVSAAVTPDGPRGPAREVNPGVILLAKKSGAPIVPLVFSSSKKKL